VSLTILNNVSSLVAENALAQASAGQQKALLQLSTGLKINSSADDAAGLSIADGLQANINALSQSTTNANNGIGFLQVADGALSQVNTMLNRAVTLATEASNSGLTTQQLSAANTEYQSILSEINQIGTATEFNGTQVFTGGGSSAIALTNGTSAITGTINPADTLSGGFDVTSTIPGSGGSGNITLTDSGGNSTAGNVTPGDTLSGGITVTSNTPEVDGIMEDVSFAASPDGSTITSSPIIAGDTLSGALDISSSGGSAPDSIGINLGFFQGLASSDPATATAAANALAANMTTAIGGTTGSTYTASISGGVLTIQTSNPVPTASDISFWSVPDPSSPGSSLMSSQLLEVGATLAGSITFTSTGGDHAASSSFDFSTLPGLASGLTSDNPAAQAVALADLGTELDFYLGPSTGSTYTASLGEYGVLNISSSNPNETLDASGSTLTQTPNLGAQNLTTYDTGIWLAYTAEAAAPGSVASGIFDVQSGAAHASINLADGYSDIFGNDADPELSNLNAALNAQLGGGGSRYYAYVVGGSLAIEDTEGAPIHTAGSSVQATLTGESLAVGGFSSGMQEAIVPAASTPTVISLAGVSTANLQSYLQTQLHLWKDVYTVNYNQSSGALSIALNSGMGVSSFSTSSTAKESPASTTATTAVSLAGLTATNLESSLQTLLGSNYAVTYNQTSGALSIGISAAGTTAGVTSIASSSNSATETAAGASGQSEYYVFTGDGTVSGNNNLNITVGSLTSASMGASAGSSGVDLSKSTLLSQSAATSALALISAAINGIASQRGVVGANINRLTATANDDNTTEVNLTSAMNSIQDADIGKTVADMTQYNILQSTGMAALQQANQAQQSVLKLIQ
jgi:flagellin